MSASTDRVISEALLALLWPELETLVEAKIGEQLRLFEAPPPEPWMTTQEAADYLKLDTEALAARARRGTIPAHKDGSRWMFKRDEIDSHLKSPRGRPVTLHAS